jgi:hypothetical protein
MAASLRMTGRQHASLISHLYPGDGLEAVSVGLCGRHRGRHGQVLLLRKLVHVPYDECRERDVGRVTWSTLRLEEILVEATANNSAVVKFHCHPGGYDAFSELDDRSDADLFASVHGWIDGVDPHASVVMLPGGRMFGRAVYADGGFETLQRIAVAGDDLRFFDSDRHGGALSALSDRQARMFGEGTTRLMRRLAVGVVGCSGTGGPTVEMLGRLGVGRIVLVDPESVGVENLGRISNATAADAEAGRLKVEVLARAVRAMGFDTRVEEFSDNLATSPRAVRALAGVDVLFGCVDSAEGRHVLNRLATFYNLPYFDVGVRLVADGEGIVEQVCGAVHYLQPDGSSLLDRRVYTMEQVRAEGMRRENPSAYADLIREKYIQGVVEARPAVVTVNTQLAAMMLNEFLARVHPYRLDENAKFAVIRLSLAQMESYYEEDGAGGALARHVGRGDVAPLLDMPELSEQKAVA